MKQKPYGWRDISKEIPEMDRVVVCTDGIHRWLDMRMLHFEEMTWQGHKPTHWHPIANLPLV